MKAMFAVAVIILMMGCKTTRSGISEAPSNSSGLAGKDWSTSNKYIKQQQKIIDQHKDELVVLGRMSKDYSSMYVDLALARYGWHGDGDGYFGAYSFYQPAFEQAKRGWFLSQGHVIEGNDELWSDENLKFDDTVKGRTVTLYMSWREKGEFKNSYFKATIIGFPPKEHCSNCLLLDKSAPHYAEMAQIQILPDDWVDMCACTNNSGPEFQNGQPVVEQ